MVGSQPFYDFEAKYLSDATEFDVPADLPADLAARIRELARQAFVALDCEGFARVDFFVEGERVTVHARARVSGRWLAISDVFAVAKPDQLSSTPETIHPGTPAEEQHFLSRPDLRPPTVTVTANSPGQAEGDIFAAQHGSWNKKVRVGYEVIRVPLHQTGKASGEY